VSPSGGAVLVGSDVCPYQGLTAFQPEHKRWFFGRARLVERLVALVERFPVVTVLGASGSGKSSLLRAGLVGTLAGEGRAVLLTPSARPVAALSTVDDSALLVVDQFEEVFTLCAAADERERFIAALLERAAGGTTVVLGVRADFLAHLTRHPGLLAAVDHEATLLVGPPSPAELKEIIVRPASTAGLAVDADLLATVLADVGAEPGALPLLSHALLETWRHRTGNALSLAAYQASGGVRGAIAQSAEQVYDALDDAERVAARLIFLRLTALGSGTEDTRRPITRAELDGIAEPAVIDAVLGRLAGARLVVLGEHTIEVAHEALIRAWPRLHHWLSEDRAQLLTHRRLTAAAQTWRELDEDPGALYRGAQLGTATSWADDHPGELNAAESAFLSASVAADDRDRVATRRRARLLTRLVAALAVLLVVAVVGAGIAVQQRREARLRQQIELSHQLALTARQVLDTAPDLAGLLSIEAYRRHADPDTLGALLSSASAARRRVDLNVGGPSVFDVAVSPDDSLLASANRVGAVDVWDVARHTKLYTLSEHTTVLKDPYVYTVAFDHSGRLLASSAREGELAASPGSLIVWDLGTRKPVFQQRFDRLENGMAISADGALVAVGVGGGSVEVFDVATGSRRVLAGHRSDVDSVTISPDGRFLVSSNDKEEPIVWELATGARLGTVPAAQVTAVAFGPDGDELTTSSIRNGVHFWNLASGVPVPDGELPLQAAFAWDISAPLGDRIAVADEYGLITVWDMRRRAPVETYQDRGRAETRSLALGRNGTLLVSGGLGRTLTLRDHAIPPFSGHSGGVNDLAVSPHGTLVASAGADGTVRLWDLAGKPVGVLGDHADRVEAAAWHPDGRQLVALTRSHTITVWDTAQLTRVRSVPYDGLGTSTDIAYHPDGRSIVTTASIRFRFDGTDFKAGTFSLASVATAVAFTPDGRFLISTSPAGGILVWDWAADKEAFRVSTGQSDIRDVAVSHDGTRIATAGADRTVKLWNMSDGKEIATLAGHTAPAQVLAFSPDDRTLASAGEDSTVITWDLARSTARPRSPGIQRPCRHWRSPPMAISFPVAIGSSATG
jgi:WD40 repeat protein